MTLMERYICQKYRRSVEPPVQFRPSGNRGKNKLAVINQQTRSILSQVSLGKRMACGPTFGWVSSEGCQPVNN